MLAMCQTLFHIRPNLILAMTRSADHNHYPHFTFNIQGGKDFDEVVALGGERVKEKMGVAAAIGEWVPFLL